ncbi:CAP domain-containing protein [Gemmatimonadota bacterium]
MSRITEAEVSHSHLPLMNKAKRIVNRGISRVIVGRTFVAMLLAAAVACDAGNGFGPDSDADPELLLFVDLVNDHRESIGCPRLVWNDDVAEVAQAHSEDMVDRDFFDHTNPDGDSPFDRLQNEGVPYSSGAENIAWGYHTAAAVLDGWLNSAGHKANIENCSLTEHGVGLHQSRWTHLFIRP